MKLSVEVGKIYLVEVSCKKMLTQGSAKAIIKMAARKLEAVHLTPEDVQLATTGIECNNLYRYRAIARYEDALEQEDEEGKKELFLTFRMHPDKNLYR